MHLRSFGGNGQSGSEQNWNVFWIWNAGEKMTSEIVSLQIVPCCVSYCVVLYIVLYIVYCILILYFMLCCVLYCGCHLSQNYFYLIVISIVLHCIVCFYLILLCSMFYVEWHRVVVVSSLYVNKEYQLTCCGTTDWESCSHFNRNYPGRSNC